MLQKEYKWYVLKTKSRHEFSVEKHFGEMGIECFCPYIWEPRIRKSGIGKTKVPLFSLYVFVKASYKEYMDILIFASVKDFIRCAGVPVAINEEQIMGLQLLIKQNEKYEATALSSRPGEQIIVKSGPFAGMKGEIVSVRGKMRFLIRIACIEYGILLHGEDLISMPKYAIEQQL